MTCVVGLVDGASVWLGADSAASAGCERFPRSEYERKIVRRDGMLFGVTGPSRAIQIIEYALQVPEHPDTLSTFAYLVKHLMPALRTAIVEHDGLKINDQSDGWEFLLAYRGGLYSICHDLSVTVLPDYGAVGCGHMIALGSLYSTLSPRTGLDAIARINLALRASARHDIHVADPFILERLD